MGIFDSIKEKILVKEVQAKPAMGSSIQALKAAKEAAKAAKEVDVAEVLDAKVKAKGQKLDWRNSIVDLLKTIDLDSSLTARKELASDLKYSGSDADGSAEKNIWLHKEVMKALSNNGGKVPAELLK